ncbi:MAG: sensor histidine kinase [Magnetospirillum sp. WYHS-4]
MLPGWLILLTSFGYLSLLFAIAYYGDRRADRGRSLIGHSSIYALSIAVYCTSWTFYGSVGRAASTGLGFLPIYLGPTLMFALGWAVIRKIVRISKVHHITSIADFVSSRYGKSHLLGGLVTVIAVVGIMPYISLQLKAVSSSFAVLLHYPDLAAAHPMSASPFEDTALLVAMVLALFTILFGTRHIDATEHHEGMVAAIAFESIVKLLAFLAVGAFVAFGIFGSPGELFRQAAAQPQLARLMSVEAIGPNWITLTLLSMAAIIFLPRQFQVTVVENVDERHLEKAVWLFPLYLFAINLFVLPITLGGLLRFPGGALDTDTFVLALPLAEGAPYLALLVFIGGLSAATGMVIVETIALSTMVCNDLIMPVLLRFGRLHLSERSDLSGLLLGIRRGAILFIILLGYLYFRLIGESYALVTIGLVSFAAAAQFAPAILGGIYWKGGSRQGAVAGLSAGFAVWAYTLLLPSFAKSGWLPESIVDLGPFGLHLLKPYALFGLEGLDSISHSLFWSLAANVGGYVAVSLAGSKSTIERIQATLFVEVFSQSESGRGLGAWRGKAAVADLRELAARFIGRERAQQAFADFGRRHGFDIDKRTEADADLVQYVERLLAGAIGAASARVMIATTVQGEGIGIEEIMEVLDETSQVLEYSRQLEHKSQELEAATRELQAANQRLKELDRMKDEFLSTVTHELRTPLTSIRSFSEILFDNPELDATQRGEFLSIVIRESERLTRLVNQVLDLAKIEAGRMDWHLEDLDLAGLLNDAAASLRGIFEERDVGLDLRLPAPSPLVRADRDHLTRVVINLLSNAQKVCGPGTGRVEMWMEPGEGEAAVFVRDNGPGIEPDLQDKIFEKFYQLAAGGTGNPSGSGLGLAICRSIVERQGGRIAVHSRPGEGATFSFTVPYPPG